MLVLLSSLAPTGGAQSPLMSSALPAFSGTRSTEGAALDSPGDQRRRAGQLALAAAGLTTALVVHESGHFLAGTLLDARPGTRSIRYAGIPFFAVTHKHVTPRKEFIISSAGFWMQHAGSEWLLTARPRLRQEHSPFLKGMLAFNIALSAMYAGSAALHAGPAERDPRSMAASLGSQGWPEGSIGVVILAPAALDGYRYFYPDQAWARWMSRALKVGCAALTLAASSHRGSALSPP